jgi:hypothetical protein
MQTYAKKIDNHVKDGRKMEKRWKRGLRVKGKFIQWRCGKIGW